MGFMDKAKKMAEQAQQKLDEAQKSFNEKQGSSGGASSGSGGSSTEFDQHGRPVNSAADAPPAPAPAGDPLAEPATTDPGPAANAPTPDPATEDSSATPDPAKAHGDPLLSDEPGSRQGHDAERQPSGPKPGMSSGDPLG